MSETQGAEQQPQTIIKPEEKPQQNGEDKAAQADPDVHTIVLQYNSKTMQTRVIFPPEVKDTITLYGILMTGVQQLIQGQLVRDVTAGVMKGLAERMAIKGRGGMHFPSAADIEKSRRH